MLDRESQASCAGWISSDDFNWLLTKAELALDLDHFCTTGEDRARLDRIKQAFQEANRPPEGDS